MAEGGPPDLEEMTEEQLLLTFARIRQLRRIDQLLQQQMEEQRKQDRIKNKILVIHDFITVCYDDLLDDLKWRCQEVLGMVDEYHKECQLRKSQGEAVDEQELEKICSEDVAQGLKEIQNALPNRENLGLDPPPASAPADPATEEIAAKEPIVPAERPANISVNKSK